LKERLLRIFNILLLHFGPRNWWPAETALEVMVGAILTQNTSWRNVEKAIAHLKHHGLLDLERLYSIEEGTLAELLRPCGFYNVKAKRLKAFVRTIYETYGPSIEVLREVPSGQLREKLLGIDGVGPETADSILLYALNRPFFVVDAYTKRFLSNHGLYEGSMAYSEIQRFFMENLPKDLYVYNEFHALIVALGQRYCKRNPLCSICPLGERRGE